MFYKHLASFVNTHTHFINPCCNALCNYTKQILILIDMIFIEECLPTTKEVLVSAKGKSHMPK